MQQRLLAHLCSAACLAAALAQSSLASAQMDFSLDEATTETPPADAAPAEETGAETGTAEEGAEGDQLLPDLAAEPDNTADEVDSGERAQQTETVEDVYAVQRTYALRLNRLEIAPSAGFTINDPYVGHPSAALALNFWFTNVLAVGLSAQWFQFGDPTTRESDLNFFTRRSTRLGIPINEWQLGAYLNFTYVPFYGKFAFFNEFIFQWDAYIVGGVGLMRTRPVPVVDPVIREFDFQNRVAFNLGLGLRVFLSRFAGVFLEFRDYAFLEKFENLEVAVGADRANTDTWMSSSTTFSNNVTVQVGLTLFFPFRFEYRLPK